MFRPVKKLLMLALWGAPFLSGCFANNAVYYTPLQSSPPMRAARNPAGVEILAIGPPTRPHRDVGLFQVFKSDADDEDVVTTLRAQAAAKGCDAVVIASMDQRNQRPTLQASCVVYEDRPTPETAQTGAPRVPAVQPPTRTSRLAVIGPSPGVVRTAPYRVAPPVTELPPAQRVQVSAVATNGWRVVMLPDGRVGYVEDAALRLE